LSTALGAARTGTVVGGLRKAKAAMNRTQFKRFATNKAAL